VAPAIYATSTNSNLGLRIVYFVFQLKFARKKSQDSGKTVAHSQRSQAPRLSATGEDDIVLNLELQKPVDKDIGESGETKVKDTGAKVMVTEEVKVTEGAKVKETGESTEAKESTEEVRILL
jgi:hypothetical protein